MTSEYERGHAAGIRDVLEILDDEGSIGNSRRRILSLLDEPAPAVVTVQEAAKVLLGVVERREWTHYPIEMPLNANMQGPAKVGKDAHCMTYEVWEADTCHAISDHNKLPDAIASWLRALSEGRT